jgi:hypothetical protein
MTEDVLGLILLLISCSYLDYFKSSPETLVYHVNSDTKRYRSKISKSRPPLVVAALQQAEINSSSNKYGTYYSLPSVAGYRNAPRVLHDSPSLD